MFLWSPRYTENASSIQQEETVVTIQFVMLDCSPLKSTLVQHCNEWQKRLTQLLSEIASTHLKELNDSMQSNANRYATISYSPAVLTQKHNNKLGVAQFSEMIVLPRSIVGTNALTYCANFSNATSWIQYDTSNLIYMIKMHS